MHDDLDGEQRTFATLNPNKEKGRSSPHYQAIFFSFTLNYNDIHCWQTLPSCFRLPLSTRCYNLWLAIIFFMLSFVHRIIGCRDWKDLGSVYSYILPSMWNQYLQQMTIQSLFKHKHSLKCSVLVIILVILLCRFSSLSWPFLNCGAQNERKKILGISTWEENYDSLVNMNSAIIGSRKANAILGCINKNTVSRLFFSILC